MKNICQLLVCFAFISCAIHEKKFGGETKYDPSMDYANKIEEFSEKIVVTTHRDNPKGSFEKIFVAPQGKLRRFTLSIFETQLQPTLDGLSAEENYYFSERGKQLWTEELYQIWQKKLAQFPEPLSYQDLSLYFNDELYKTYEVEFKDYLLKEDQWKKGDVNYLVKGKITPMATTFMPRKFRDLSFIAAPATQLFIGSKPTDYHKYWINDLSKKFFLDGHLMVYSYIKWRKEGYDREKKEKIPEGVSLEVKATFLVPFAKYQMLKQAAGYTEDVTPLSIAYRNYEVNTFIPLSIKPAKTVEEVDSFFQESLKKPVESHYQVITDLIIQRLKQDLEKTL